MLQSVAKNCLRGQTNHMFFIRKKLFNKHFIINKKSSIFTAYYSGQRWSSSLSASTIIGKKVDDINHTVNAGHKPDEEDQPLNAISNNNSRVGVNTFVNRSHTCGQLTAADVGHRVRLSGWIQYQRYGKFMIIRDSYGTTQVMLGDRRLQKVVNKLTTESVVEVVGQVVNRPAKDVNNQLSTGSVEVIADEVTVLNECRRDLPFVVRDYNKVTEKTRLEYRYIDLRHQRLQRVLRLRSAVINKMRQLLADKYGFVEVETPTLFKPTPGGAKEFVVSTDFKDQFYNLVQSPQQFKQLLMIGGIDRYFQIARCYRNEGTKPDRQPEFTQLDLEMSFTNEDGIMSLIEEVIQYCWPFSDDNIQLPFRRMTYSDAIRDYGSDKPDLRSDTKLKEINIKHQLMSDNTDDEICVTYLINTSDMETKDKLTELKKSIAEIKREFQYNGRLDCIDCCEDYLSSFDQIGDNLKTSITNELDSSSSHLTSDDHLFVAIGAKDDVYQLMGRLRADWVKLTNSHNNNKELSFIWITDFPLFLQQKDSSQLLLESAHHPFTAPQQQHLEQLYTDPLSVLGRHFDLVLNGQEVGGGSIRIHDHKMQEFVLKQILKEDTDSMQYFLDALRSGCPPHGGIALGLDRLIAIMCRQESIRDVMAFPKSANGRDLMAGSPAPLAPAVRQHYHLN